MREEEEKALNLYICGSAVKLNARAHRRRVCDYMTARTICARGGSDREK